MPLDAPGSQSDLVSLAPLRRFFQSSRTFFLVGFTGLFVCGLALTLGCWWVSPKMTYGSLGLSINFRGAQQGLYPNNLPFSVEDLLALPLLRVVYDRNRLKDFVSFEDFCHALTIRQDGMALLALQKDFEASLENKDLTEPDRQRLKDEYQSRKHSATSSDYTLVWSRPGRLIPMELQAKVLEDIPRVWAQDALEVKKVLRFAVPLPNPRMLLDVDQVSGDPFGASQQLSERAGVLGTGLNSISTLPGASQAALPDGTGLIDLQIRHRAFCEQDLEAFENRLLFQQGSALEAALIQEALTFQIRSREEELDFAQRRVGILTQSFQDYLDGRQVRQSSGEKGAGDKAADSQELPAPDPASPEVPILGGLAEVASIQQEQEYRKEFIDRITRARAEASAKEVRLEESRRNTFMAKKDAMPLASRVGSAAAPGDPALKFQASAKPLPPMDMNEFSAIWGQLNELIGLSQDLVDVISQNYLGNDHSLYSVSRPFRQETKASLGGRMLALALATWWILGFGGLLVVRGVIYRLGDISKNTKTKL